MHLRVEAGRDTYIPRPTYKDLDGSLRYILLTPAGVLPQIQPSRLGFFMCWDFLVAE